MPAMYEDFARFWPLLSPLADYAGEASFFSAYFLRRKLSPEATLLELGCGGGSMAYYLKKHFAHAVLTDLSPQMLEQSRIINPDCEHLLGDMRTLRLDRHFDVVFVHDAIQYMLEENSLSEALRTAYLHIKPGGCALFVPDVLKETFVPYTDHGGSDAGNNEDVLGIRYLEWVHDPDPVDTTFVMEFVYLVHEKGENGEMLSRTCNDKHTCGIFPRETWLKLMREVGFMPEILHDDNEREVFVGHVR